MKEVTDILKSYALAKSAGKKSALATVVKVEGSSYRQPGARMLVTDDGLLTGVISGGCLEGDALRKALLAINQKQNKLITYDTSNEDDVEFGVQLGCNGIVHILFEYINEEDANNPIELLKKLETVRKEAVILILFSLNRNAPQIGTQFIYRDETDVLPNNFTILHSYFNQVVRTKTSIINTIIIENNTHEVMIEYIAPPVSLLIAGAGNDVQPLTKMADFLGWEVTLGDGRATHSTEKRFPNAKKVIVAKPQQLLESVVIDARTFAVLMTHNYKYDLEMLELLLKTNCSYIGVLGPKTKLERMFDDLAQQRITLTDEQLGRIYGPVGLDIGGETSEEIALSIVAEIKAVMEGKNGTSLKFKKEKIHQAANAV